MWSRKLGSCGRQDVTQSSGTYVSVQNSLRLSVERSWQYTELSLSWSNLLQGMIDFKGERDDPPWAWPNRARPSKGPSSEGESNSITRRFPIASFEDIQDHMKSNEKTARSWVQPHQENQQGNGFESSNHKEVDFATATEAWRRTLAQQECRSTPQFQSCELWAEDTHAEPVWLWLYVILRENHTDNTETNPLCDSLSGHRKISSVFLHWAFAYLNRATHSFPKVR